MLALALALALVGPPAAAAPPPASEAALRREVEQLRREHALAASKGAFYLRLDAAKRQLALMLEGVRLDVYAASGVEWGVPRIAFVDWAHAEDWDQRTFSRGELSPGRARDRLEVVAPPPATPGPDGTAAPTPSPPPVPKSAEEAYSVPARYRILFAEGVSLEIRSRGGARNRSWLRRALDVAWLRLADLRVALGSPTGERVRLRVTLEADDAASLYRSLPPDVGMIVVGLPASF